VIQLLAEGLTDQEPGGRCGDLSRAFHITQSSRLKRGVQGIFLTRLRWDNKSTVFLFRRKSSLNKLIRRGIPPAHGWQVELHDR
jgi:hypothetical protein